MKNEENIERVTPILKEGLSQEQVDERIKQGLTNKTKIVVGKTYLEIILSDVFSFFNILMFIIAGLMIAAQYWLGLTFLVVLIPNIAISLYEDIKARHLMSKLRVLTQPKVTVIRNGQEIVVPTNEVVLDDLVCLKAEDQICVDGPLLSGNLIVNESALTGESKNIVKKKGDVLFSGSYIVSGKGFMLADKIGEESYIESLQSKAKKFKRSPSEILRTLNMMFKIIGSIVVAMAIAIFVVYLIKGGFSTFDNFKSSMKGISGSMLAMIPAGLYLLTSVALAVAVLKLSKRGARVQDFYSVEMLARINVLCVDKTGTITNGEMDVTNVIPFGLERLSEDAISQIMSNLLIATKDSNLTAKSLQKRFNYEISKGIVAALPFNSDNKYSAATFTGNETYVLGAPEFINLENRQTVINRCVEYTSRGLRVLVLGKSKAPIKDDKVDGIVNPIALIVLQDHIREDAIETFKWFKDNNVAIKVISGDDAQTVSHIALEAGIENADKFISLAGLSDEEVADVADKYQIFGRVTPEQKEILIMTLKKLGNTVAMTGDGVNDVLALKRADCSIAMNTGSQAAKNVSHIVLVDSDFSSLPSVVEEGRRVINNLQRTSSLFLTKTIFAMVSTLVFLITYLTINVRYPFEATHFQLWSLVNIGLSSFFLALEANKEPAKGGFAKNILSKTIPGALAILIPVAIIYVLYIFQQKTIFYTGIYAGPEDNPLVVPTTMSVITFTILGLVILLKICLPLNLYRSLVFAGAVLVEGGLLTAAGFVSYKVSVQASVLGIDFPSLTLVNWFTIAIIVVLTVSIYLIVSYIVETLKGEHIDDKD